MCLLHCSFWFKLWKLNVYIFMNHTKIKFSTVFKRLRWKTCVSLQLFICLKSFTTKSTGCLKTEITKIELCPVWNVMTSAGSVLMHLLTRHRALRCKLTWYYSFLCSGASSVIVVINLLHTIRKLGFTWKCIKNVIKIIYQSPR